MDLCLYSEIAAEVTDTIYWEKEETLAQILSHCSAEESSLLTRSYSTSSEIFLSAFQPFLSKSPSPFLSPVFQRAFIALETKFWGRRKMPSFRGRPGMRMRKAAKTQGYRSSEQLPMQPAGTGGPQQGVGHTLLGKAGLSPVATRKITYVSSTRSFYDRMWWQVHGTRSQDSPSFNSFVSEQLYWF